MNSFHSQMYVSSSEDIDKVIWITFIINVSVCWGFNMSLEM